jgi:hypothetical protein
MSSKYLNGFIFLEKMKKSSQQVLDMAKIAILMWRL